MPQVLLSLPWGAQSEFITLFLKNQKWNRSSWLVKGNRRSESWSCCLCAGSWKWPWLLLERALRADMTREHIKYFCMSGQTATTQERYLGAIAKWSKIQNDWPAAHQQPEKPTQLWASSGKVWGTPCLEKDVVGLEKTNSSDQRDAGVASWGGEGIRLRFTKSAQRQQMRQMQNRAVNQILWSAGTGDARGNWQETGLKQRNASTSLGGGLWAPGFAAAGCWGGQTPPAGPKGRAESSNPGSAGPRTRVKGNNRGSAPSNISYTQSPRLEGCKEGGRQKAAVTRHFEEVDWYSEPVGRS